METNKSGELLYPILHSDRQSRDYVDNAGVQEKLSFRLNKISDIQNLLEHNIKERRSLNKKYSKASKIVNVTEVGLTTASIGMGSVGIGLLATVIAAPVALGMEIAAIIAGSSSVLCKVINRKLIKKAQKHKEIKILAQAKLNTILDLISKAINDNKISDEEFTLILNEYVKFQTMKEQIIEHSANKTKVQGSKSSVDELKPSIGRAATPSMNKVYEDFRLNIDNIQLLLNRKEQSTR
jgi:hypothetical protein